MKTAAYKASFKSVLAKFSPETGWHFVVVTKKVVDGFRFDKGGKRVICTLNGSEVFPCGLMPYDGDFFIMVNKGIRTRLGIEAGDRVQVELVRDESKYGMPMPEELQEVLNQDDDGDRFFHALTPGKQRSMLYYIGKIKDIDKRIQTSLIFIEHLKRNDGKLVYQQLHDELKRP